MSTVSEFLDHSNHTLLVIDGSSFLYRAYHGLPDLRSPTGEPTGALYGMIAMLKRLRNIVPTEHAVCVFDAKGKTFRDDWYPEYKANRAKMPDDLVAQIEPIEAVVRALGFPVVIQDGVEADDVIGTLAHKAQAAGWRTVMATGDKDLTQLVNSEVLWFNTMSGDALDVAGVTAKFGIPPERIVDYLTLVGDSVDNVPGVEKVGPKTAVKWLTEFGTLDDIVAHADEIKGKVGEYLRSALDWLPQARKLVTVVCDLDLSATLPDWQNVQYNPADNAALLAIYQRAGFKTWTKELIEQGEQPSVNTGQDDDLFSVPQEETVVKPVSKHEEPSAEPHTLTPFTVQKTIVNTPELLDEMMVQIERSTLVALDTETTSLNSFKARLVGLSFALNGMSGWYVPVAHEGMQSIEQLPMDTVLARLKPWLENSKAHKIGQHLKYDTHVFANHGIALRGVVHDTLLQSYVLDSTQPHRLDAIAARYLHVSSLTYEDICGKGANQMPFAQVDIEKAATYAVEDVAICIAVHEKMYPQICADVGLKTIYETIELPTSEVLYQMERNGVLLDVNELHRQSHALGQTLLQLEKTAHELAGQPFNLNSPKQIGELFFEKLGMPVVKKTSKGAPSTDEEVLQKLAEDYPLPKAMLEYRSLSKLKSTYTDSLPTMIEGSTGRVHTHYAQAVAVTGRLSSNDPNLQNIPVRTELGRKVRTAFIAPEGSVMMSADYSQIELRILAHMSQDPVLIEAFNTGIDVHTRTAAQIFSVPLAEVSFEQRRMAKVINFGLIYGMSAFGLANNLGISRAAAQQYIDQYFIQYPSVLHYMEQTKQFAREHGYVTTHFGRRLYLPDINNRNMGKRQGAERAAINAPMQGTSADLIKLAMIAVQSALTERGLKSKLVMQVHDELVLEVVLDELELLKGLIPELMSGVAKLSVPLLAEVGVGANWELAH
ncbi:MAG: DNA polymerase I [Burkholderiales bacterium]|nr:DNA polymerase I [Burkholderiales bacterium]